jgi:flagellar basal body L-ring protein FlgH
MKICNFLLVLFTVVLISGCSSKSKGFFEDLYSKTEVRSATKQNYASIKSATNVPIVNEVEEEESTKKNKNYSSDSSQIYTATGKIIDADYDKDVNLYIYAFLKSGTAVPISFYYDQDLRPIGDIVTVTIKDNFLTEYSKGTKKVKKTRTEKRSRKRSWKKRKKSNIQTPFVEKINTL